MIKLCKISTFKMLFFALTIGILNTSCDPKCEEDCATFEDFKMCDSKPSTDGCSGNLNVFAQDADYFTVSVEIAEGEPTDRLSVKFFIKNNGAFVEFKSQTITLQELDGIDGDERKIIASTGLNRKETELWPVGEYKVELELSQEVIPLNATRNFSVE